MPQQNGHYTRKFIFQMMMALILMTGCDLKFATEDTITSGDSREFWVHDLTKSAGQNGFFISETFVFRASNNAAAVYVSESENNSVSDQVISNLLAEFQNKMVAKVQTIYGSVPDLDSNGKVNLLLHDIKDDGISSNGYVAGYFYGIDYFSQSSLNSLGYKSNEGEYLYIDVEEGDITSTSLWATIAHEFEHLVSTYDRTIQRDFKDLDTWADEGMAEHFEYIVYGQSAVQSRFQYMSTSQFNDSQSLVNWNTSNSLSNYSLSATYFNYLSNQVGDMNDFMKTVNRHDHGNNSSSDQSYRAIGDALADVYEGGTTGAFRRSFWDYAVNGLLKVQNWPAVTKGSSNVVGKFEGIGFQSSVDATSQGFVPRFLKFSTSSSISASGAVFYDASKSVYTELSADTISAFDGNDYGVILLTPLNTNDDFNFISTNRTPISVARGKTRPQDHYFKLSEMHEKPVFRLPRNLPATD